VLSAGEQGNSCENAGYLDLVLPVEVLAGRTRFHDDMHCFVTDRSFNRKRSEQGDSEVETVAFAEF
jgi:hypothetical protein